MRRGLVAVILVGLFAATALAASSPTRTSFANGTWTGTARLNQNIEGLAVVANSTFTMQVQSGRVSGTLSSRGTATAVVEGVRIVITMSGRYPFSGPPGKPVARGTMMFAATVQGKRQTASGPVINAFVGLRGTCARMTGKIVLRAADADPGSQAPDDVSAPFVAARTAGSGPAC